MLRPGLNGLNDDNHDKHKHEHRSALHRYIGGLRGLNLQAQRQRRAVQVCGRKRKSGGGNRAERLQVLYQRVMEFEFEYGITDPSLASCQLLEVEMQPDLSVLRLYVGADSSKQTEIKEGLKRAKGYLRGVMSREIQIMRTPDIKFIIIPIAGEGEFEATRKAHEEQRTLGGIRGGNRGGNRGGVSGGRTGSVDSSRQQEYDEALGKYADYDYLDFAEGDDDDGASAPVDVFQDMMQKTQDKADEFRDYF